MYLSYRDLSRCIDAGSNDKAARRPKLFYWRVRERHVLDAILLLRRHVAVLVFVDHVYVLFEIPTGVGLFFDRYEQPLKEASQSCLEHVDIEQMSSRRNQPCSMLPAKASR
jgi:hypothetical protein